MMAKFPIPYLYANPSFWGDPRDDFYGEDFVGMPYQGKNQKNEKNTVLTKMYEYIKYIESKEENLMTKLQVNNLKAATFSLWEDTPLLTVSADARNALKEITERQEKIANEVVGNYYETQIESIREITEETSLKEVSAFILKQLQDPSTEQIPISTFLPAVMKPMQKILSQPNRKNEQDWKDFLETQAKLFSYIIDFFKDKTVRETVSNTKWYTTYFPTIQQMEQELRAHKLKRDTKKVVGVQTSDTKFTFSGRNGTVMINLVPYRKSVNDSLNNLIRKDFPTTVEKQLTKALSHLNASHTGAQASTGGTTYLFQYIIPEIQYTEQDEEEKNYEKKYLKNMYDGIKTNLSAALERRRTVKSDIFLDIDEGYGISVKSGQQDTTKLDTRSNFYTFINFISQYSPEIAQTLLQPQNLHILINIVQAQGTFNSESLNEALNMIAYAFFGATTNQQLNEYTQYFDKIGRRYGENVLIINDNGICTRISTYLWQIYYSLLTDIKIKDMLYSVSTTFTGEAKHKQSNEYPENPHPSYHQVNTETPEFLKNIAVSTYIKTFH